MSYLWKTLGVAVAGLACWAAAGAAAAPPAAPAPAAESARPADPEESPARPAQTARSLNVLRGSANGVGNTVIIANGSGRSTTVLKNSRSGVGNRVVIVDGEVVTDEAPARPRDSGLKFGDVKYYSPAHGCTLYWDPRALGWYRYDADLEEYVPAE
jgi:hypothetical protein